MKAFIVHAVAATAVSLLSLSSLAATPPKDTRAAPGTVVPSTGATAPAHDPPRAASGNDPHPESTATSLSGPTPASCAEMRKRFAESQACFAPYRMANGAVRPEAYKHCHQMTDPSAGPCGPAIVSPGN